MTRPKWWDEVDWDRVNVHLIEELRRIRALLGRFVLRYYQEQGWQGECYLETEHFEDPPIIHLVLWIDPDKRPGRERSYLGSFYRRGSAIRCAYMVDQEKAQAQDFVDMVIEQGRMIRAEEFDMPYPGEIWFNICVSDLRPFLRSEE